MIKDHNPELSSKCMEIIECDTARISKQDKFFLVIGFNRNTKDSPGQWVDENGNDRDWNYIEEKTVASGMTEEELIQSVEEYKRLCGITMIEYLLEKVADQMDQRKNENIIDWAEKLSGDLVKFND